MQGGVPSHPRPLFKGDIPIIIMVSSCILGMSMMGLTQFLPYMLLSPESSVIKEKKMINISAVMIPLGQIELVMSSHLWSHWRGQVFLCIFIGAAMHAVSMTLFTLFHYTLVEALVCLIIYVSFFSLVFVSCVNLIMMRVSVHEFSILCGATLW